MNVVAKADSENNVIAMATLKASTALKFMLRESEGQKSGEKLHIWEV